MPVRHRRELERRYLEAVKNLVFRILSRREDEPERRDAMILPIREPVHWESMRSEEVDEALRMVNSIGNKIMSLYGKVRSAEPKGH